MKSEQEIKQAIQNVKDLGLAKIVRYESPFIIMAQSERDYRNKRSKINHGDTRGFYTVESALKIQKP